MILHQAAPTQASPGSPPLEAASALSPRALLIGACCAALTSLFVCYAELVVAKIQIGFQQLPPVVVGMLVLLLGGQQALRTVWRRAALAAREIYTIYVMMLLAAMVSSRGVLEKLVPLLPSANYYANPGNGWRLKLFPNIPRWAVPWDPAGPIRQWVSVRFYEGLRPGESIPWRLWFMPLASWALFVCLILTAYLCMAVILRRQWADNEKLSFPLAQLPLEMIRAGAADETGDSANFMGRPLTWLGFAIPAVVFGLKGLHQYAPSFPDVPTEFDLNTLFTQPPLNQMNMLEMFVSFAAIGFFYLLPADLLFSLWFFFLWTRVEDVLAAMWGYQPQMLPLYGCRVYQGYEIMGAYFALAGTMAYSALPHLKRVARSAFTRSRLPEEAGEVISYRTALWGLIGAIALMLVWLRIFGVALWLSAFAVFVALFVVTLVMARSTSEAGMLMTETSFRPIDVYRMVGDPARLGAANVTGLAMLDAVWFRDQRGLVLTGFLDSMKLSDGARVRKRSLLGVFALAIAVAFLVGGYLHVSLPYHFGAANMYDYAYQGNPIWALSDAAHTLSNPRPPSYTWNSANFAIGAAIALALAAMRSRFYWFPFHPLGFALSGSWTMIVFWFPCLAAWVIKTLVLRYGGMRMFRQLRPLFLGMVLGEFTMAVLFTLPAVVNRYTPTPSFPWP